MNIFVFCTAAGNPKFVGFSVDEHGANLPLQRTPWLAVGVQAMPIRDARADRRIRALQSAGFYLTSAPQTSEDRLQTRLASLQLAINDVRESALRLEREPHWAEQDK